MKNYLYALHCIDCKTIYPLDPLYTCEKCGGILEAFYDYEGLLEENVNASKITDLNKSSLLPIIVDKNEQFPYFNSPLIKANNIGKEIGIENLYFKLEFNTITGSFKDRPVYIGIKKAKDFGYKKVVVASSGNGASAAAAYAAREGLTAIILVPASTPNAKVAQALAYGAQLIKVEGPYSNSFELALSISQEGEAYNVTTTFLNPYTVEGNKTVAYELIESFNEEKIDNIIVPIGAGPLLVGIYKGFYENSLLAKSSIPKMVGVQSKGCNPIAKAYKNNEETVKAEYAPNTIAGGISDGLVGYAQDGTYTLNTIKKSNGIAAEVTDESIVEAKKLLAEKEGLYVENAAAASIAVLINNVNNCKINKSENTVAILTGHGLKENIDIEKLENIPTIINSVERLRELI